MLRKIVKQGNSALTITLPSAWSKKLNLKAGGELNLEEQDGKLLVSPEKYASRVTSIDTSELNDILIWTYIIGAYRKGYDEIQVKFKKDQIKLVQQAVNALLGLAIIEQSQESCKIKDLSTPPTEPEFSSMIRRIFYLLEEMADSSLKSLKEKNKHALKNIELQDYNVNKFSNFCLRVASKKNLASTLEYIISELENIGDEYARLSLDLSKSQLSISPSLIKIFDSVNEFFFQFHKFYYEFSNKKAVELVEVKNKINKEIEFAKPKSKEDTSLLFHLSKIVHLVINIGERVIMMNLPGK
jgi:phosphate uptake regulator